MSVNGPAPGHSGIHRPESTIDPYGELTMGTYNLSEAQARAILELRLQRLNARSV